MSTEQTTPKETSFSLKPIRKEGIPQALEKVEQYRLLNEPLEAESICRDVLAIDPENQKGIVAFLLTLSDRFIEGKSVKEAIALIPRIQSKYEQQYYKALILERQGKAALLKGYPGCKHDAFEWLEEAMHEFELADKLSDQENNDAILRWNTCVRIIENRRLTARPPDTNPPILE
jgi:hypothetical protein